MARKTLVAALLDRLTKALGKDIFVSVNPEEVVFHRGEKVLRLRPFVILSTDPEPRILAVGDQVPLMEPSVVIGLLDPASRAELASHKPGCLEAFFRFAFIQLAESHTMIRPRVEISVTEEVSQRLCGYEAAVLRSACIASGARECIVRASWDGCSSGRRVAR